MKFIIEPPQSMEAVKTEVTDGKLEVIPVAIKGQHIMRAGYLTAVGDGGAEVRSVVLFNANTGDFTVQRTDGDQAQFDFDLPKAEFIKKRTAAKQSAKQSAKSRKRQDNITEDEKTD